MKRQILITNDDGIRAPALDVLARALGELGQPTIVAPEREMSAKSHAITLNQPLRYRKLSSHRFAVEGTPADCVIMACLRILPDPPDLIVSGINRGRNVGDSVMYSGTIAAAFEGALQGVPSIAVSMEYREPMDYDAAADTTAVLAHRVLEGGLPPGIVLNLNFPADWNGRVVLARQGEKEGKTVLVENLDPEGEQFWLHQELHDRVRAGAGDLPADYEALEDGYAALTPLQLDRTAYPIFEPLGAWSDLLDRKAYRD